MIAKKVGRKEIGSEKHCWLRNDNGFLTMTENDKLHKMYCINCEQWNHHDTRQKHTTHICLTHNNCTNLLFISIHKTGN